AINELIASRQMSIAEHEHTIKGLEKSLSEFKAIIAELDAVIKTLEQLRELDRQITGRIANLRQSIERCKALREKVDKLRKELEKAKKDRAIYNDLVTAFGKKGVQALIIENAIPEIQEEANRLLARMTDNSMQVSLETLRDKKTGGTAETLDIKISDDMGTRSYELYSGGEAFRVNLALRIALSKLLARRAGARLQTLIIDEGFGTQDGKGREKLVDAINSIKDDFEKILVITHIDELKDAFPTRIEITKDLQGSKISIS
ncbi:MAG: SMC family ATPase, partial [Armatimonadetes bacterium]|nr:SMC family ATPase [Armatimonadota bacterium]